jgi:hypothetical protein
MFPAALAEIREARRRRASEDVGFMGLVDVICGYEGMLRRFGRAGTRNSKAGAGEVRPVEGFMM